MTWSWSHTNEAYRNAELNLRDLATTDLVVIASEWKAYDGDSFNPGFHTGKYHRAMKRYQKKWIRSLANKFDQFGNGIESFRSMLVDFIWERASEYATCDNGGWNAWLCPYGCGCHTVSFSREQEQE